MKRRISIGAWTGLVCSVVLSAVFAGQDSTAPVDAQGVVVQAKPLRELRADARKAQRRFETLYGQLNQDADQQMSCEDSASTGSHFTKHTCTTRAADAAKSLAAQGYVGTADLNASVPGQAAAASPSPVSTASSASSSDALSERYASQPNAVDLKGYQGAYWKNLQKLMEQNPDLRKRFEEYAQAKAQLEAAEGSHRADK